MKFVFVPRKQLYEVIYCKQTLISSHADNRAFIVENMLSWFGKLKGALWEFASTTVSKYSKTPKLGKSNWQTSSGFARLLISKHSKNLGPGILWEPSTRWSGSMRKKVLSWLCLILTMIRWRILFQCLHPRMLISISPHMIANFFRWVCTRAISRTKKLSCSWRRTRPSSCQTSTTSSVSSKRFPCTLTLALVSQYIYHFSGFPFLTPETFASPTTQQQSPKQMSITTYKSFKNCLTQKRLPIWNMAITIKWKLFSEYHAHTGCFF